MDNGTVIYLVALSSFFIKKEELSRHLAIKAEALT
jgi:hypothetical protein